VALRNRYSPIGPVDHLFPVHESNQYPLNLGLDKQDIGVKFLAPTKMGGYQSPHLSKRFLLYSEQRKMDIHPEQCLPQRDSRLHHTTMRRVVEQVQ
jgi:hypothetical protein